MLKHFFALITACSGLAAVELTHDITREIHEIDVVAQHGFKKIADVAQYKNADWSQVVGISKGITLADAFFITDRNPNITYFFHMKGQQMILEKEDGSYRVFRKGDAVFFTGEPWWGSAPGFADGYIRTN